MRWIIGLLIVLLAGFAAYVRFAPIDIARWHVTPAVDAPGDYPAAGGFAAVRVTTAPPQEVLTALDAVVLQTPRTERLAGSVEEEILTYVTRSRIMGFPDYTTVRIDRSGAAPVLVIHGRLRFGQSDLGVNKARVQSWLMQLGDLIVAP